MCVLCKPRKNNTDMFANIKSEKYSFPSPFWDNVSEEAKVSHSASLTVEYTIILIPRPLSKIGVAGIGMSLLYNYSTTLECLCIHDMKLRHPCVTGLHQTPTGGRPTEALLVQPDATALLAGGKPMPYHRHTSNAQLCHFGLSF